jgi:hypothetical protein
LSQTTQLSKSTIHYPIRRHLRSQFQVLMSLGVDLDRPTLIFGDNMSVVLNKSVPSSVLKKKYNTMAYHRLRQAIAAKGDEVCICEEKKRIIGCSVFLRLKMKFNFRIGMFRRYLAD